MRIDARQFIVLVLSVDNTERVLPSSRKIIGKSPILLAEMLTVRETILATIQKIISNVIVESDSQIAMQEIICNVIVENNSRLLLGPSGDY